MLVTADRIVDFPPWKAGGLPGNKKQQFQQEGMVVVFDLVSSQLGNRGSTH